MLVESISVKNFKLLGDFSVEGLRRVTLLGGDNGCGKTTLLEAVQLCFDRRASNTFVPLFPLMRDPRMLNMNTVPHLFHNRNIRGAIETSCVADGNSYKTTAEFVSEWPDKTEEVSLKNVAQNGGKPVLASDAKLIMLSFFQNDNPQGRLFVGFDESSMRNRREHIQPANKGAIRFHNGFLEDVDDMNSANFSRLIMEGEKSAMLDTLKLFVRQVQDMDLVKIDEHSHVFVQMKNEKKQVPAAMLGGGACKFLSLVLALYAWRGMLFLLDEVTVGWHHSHLVDLWKMIFRVCKERGHQVIATTHSREGIAAFAQAAQDEDAQEDACYIRLDKWDEETDPKQKVTSATYDGKLLWSATHQLEEEVR